MTVTEMVIAYKAGEYQDEKLFNAIVDELGGKIRSTIYNFVRCHSVGYLDCDDLFQECLKKVRYMIIPNYDPSKSSFETYMYNGINLKLRTIYKKNKDRACVRIEDLSFLPDPDKDNCFMEIDTDDYLEYIKETIKKEKVVLGRTITRKLMLKVIDYKTKKFMGVQEIADELNYTKVYIYDILEKIMEFSLEIFKRDGIINDSYKVKAVK